MKNKKIISLTAMSLVLGSTMATANAANSVTARLQKPAGFSIENDDRQAARAAIESGDFAAWVAAVESGGNRQLLEMVTADNFSRYAEAVKLREAGDAEGARTILEELGLSGMEPGGPGMHGRGIDVSEEEMEALELAIKNSDYNAWKTVVEKVQEEQAQEFLTEENFQVLVRAYKLKASGDAAGAMTLLRDSNIPGFLLMPGEVRHGNRGEGGEGSEENHAAILAAYQSGDYAAWKAIIDERGGGKIAELVTADNFAQFAKAKVLQSEGKRDEARAILDDLGFPFQERGVGTGRPEMPAKEAAVSN